MRLGEAQRQRRRQTHEGGRYEQEHEINPEGGERAVQSWGAPTGRSRRTAKCFRNPKAADPIVPAVPSRLRSSTTSVAIHPRYHLLRASLPDDGLWRHQSEIGPFGRRPAAAGAGPASALAASLLSTDLAVVAGNLRTIPGWSETRPSGCSDLAYLQPRGHVGCQRSPSRRRAREKGVEASGSGTGQ